jgi:uncharacterized protein (TIGR03437 family)
VVRSGGEEMMRLRPRLGEILIALLAMSALAAGSTVRPALSYSKTFGGSGADVAMAVATDAVGNVYITGFTNSADLPIRNGLQTRLGGTPLRATRDGGRSWVAPDIAPGVNSIADSPAQPGVLYAGTAGGVYKSADSGETWRILPSAPAVATGAVIVDSANPAVVYAATEQGVFKSMDGGATWTVLNPAPANIGYYETNLFVHPARPSTLFASLNYSLYRSVDAGESWTRLANLPFSTISLVFDPANPDVVYAAAWSLGVYCSVDGGDSWKKMVDLPVTYSPSAIAASPTGLYVATSNGVIRSTDGGVRWSPTSITAPADVVAADPNNPQVVYATADQLYVSRDNGASWSALLDVPAHSVATIGITPSALFVGSVLPQNIFVTKWSADGKQMLYSTYLGGSYSDYATGIAADRDGNVYVTGFTYSTDFPVTAGALQRKLAGQYNPFVAKIGADGSKLLYSTFLGGSGGDSANAIAIDASGNAYVTGYAGSSDFPVTQGAFQTSLSHGCVTSKTEGDAFVAKIDPQGGALLFSTYLGGTCADQGLGVAVDNAGSVYVAGVTSSPDFPVTKEALTTHYGGGANNGFLAKLTSRGDGLEYSTFLGTGWGDVAQAVAVDDKGNVYVTGSSSGLDVPQPGPGFFVYGTAGSPMMVGSRGPAFVLKLDSSGAKVYATYLGQCFTTGTSIAVNSEGMVWLAGTTGGPIISATSFYGESLGNPSFSCFWATVSTVHPFQGLGLGHGFVSELSADGGTVLFSSLLDSAASLALDGGGNASVVGLTDTTNGPKRWPSALLLRIDGSVTSPVTIEEPHSKAMQPHFVNGYPAVAAPGSVVVLPGTGLGPDLAVGSQITPEGTLATSLAGTSVMFDGISAPMISVQAQQVVCLAPFGIADRTTTTVQVKSGDSFSNAIRLPVTPSAVAVLGVLNEDGTGNSKDRPAAPGSVITIYVAGLGPTEPPAVDGMINRAGAPSPKAAVDVLINWWLPGDMLYAGPAPGQPAGIAQINFRVPPTIPGIGPWPAGQYYLVVGTGGQFAGDHDVAQLAIR